MSKALNGYAEQEPSYCTEHVITSWSAHILSDAIERHFHLVYKSDRAKMIYHIC